jgi:hypothetical protein
MTRINAGIPPANLIDSHLLAEFREITRVITLSEAYHSKNPTLHHGIPKEFTLGTGHVIFFYDKLFFIMVRYKQLHLECLNRGFKVTYYTEGNPHYMLQGDYEPTQEAIELLKTRIRIRIKQSFQIPRYYGKIITMNDAIKLLNIKR